MAQMFATVSPAMHKEFELALPDAAGSSGSAWSTTAAASRWTGRWTDHPQTAARAQDLHEPVGERGARRAEDRARTSSSRASRARPCWPGTRGTRRQSRPDLRATLDACAKNGCPLEFILKDISTVRYQPQRLWEWERIARRVVEE